MVDTIDLDEEAWRPRRERLYRPHVDPFNEYDDVEFYQRYRFSKNSVNELCRLLEGDVCFRRTSKRSCTISAASQIFTALRYYGSGPFQLLDAESIGISQPATSKALTNVSEALCRQMDNFIKIPEGDEAGRCKRAFYDIAKLKNVISCIDCTHIRIVRPSVNEEQFVNRKGYHSINVQAACDAECKFTNVYAKWPGGSHDSFILRSSRFWEEFEQNPTKGIVLGDSGYPCRYWLMPPFERPNGAEQEKFNKAHRKTRVLVEQAFGRLKRRFNVMHQENRRALRNVLSDIGACFVLQNFAVSRNEPDTFDDIDDEDAGDPMPVGESERAPRSEAARIAAGVNRRLQIAREMGL